MQAILRQIVNGTLGSSEPDAELLRRFAAERDPEAFGQLVRRYGGLVWGLCRHLLASEADADDAFQATFLALAKSAGAIRSADRLGPWLHGVAYRVCRNARRQAARRARREQATARSEAARPVADSAWDALLAAVHEELHGLPDKLRVAFILCYLEGKATTEAAEQVGVKLGTFSARLSRAKDQLLARLSARGLAAGAGVLAAMTGGPASAALVERAVELAVASSGVPAVILSLTNGVLLMGVTKLKIAATVGLLVGVLALGGLWSLQAQPPGAPPGAGAGGGLFGGKIEGQPDPKALPQLQAEIERLRAQIAVKEAELRLRQDEVRAREKERVKASEFRYVAQKPGYAPTPEDFEKAVREGEKEGYRFLGVVTMTAEEKASGKPAAVPTLVFRRAMVTGGGMMGGFGGLGGPGAGAGFGQGGPGGAGGFNPGPGGVGGPSGPGEGGAFPSGPGAGSGFGSGTGGGLPPTGPVGGRGGPGERP